jgi:methylmalonyl-CoA mutase N-terminal domain/subunit
VSLYDPVKLAQWAAAQAEWSATTLRSSLERLPERQEAFSTLSGEPVQRLYGPLEAAESDALEQVGFPGAYPYTRGIHATGHRARLWTMRMFAGFGSAEETNARFRYLLSQGQTGLSIAFDMPTLYGYDTDAPEAEGEFGRCGVACASLRDMQILLDGLPLDKITTSMTVNSPAAMIWAMYIVAAERRGISASALGGTLQNDILKEYIAQKEFIFPPRPSMRLVTDTIEFATQHLPLWNPVSVSGYHIREAGSTAAQELAFTLADGFEYVRWALERGLAIDDFAPRISFFFNAHNDFFEEIAKYRAARRIWAHEMRHTFGAQAPRSWLLRFHTQTAGVSLTAQQPLNNVARVALQALAAVLGGTQSLHTNSMDEALALPSEDAVTVALRTQQIIAHETGVTNTVDPLGGSWFVEAQTNRIEQLARDFFRRIDELGGVLPALEEGFFQREIAEAALRFQREVEAGRRTIVGVSDFVSGEQVRVPLLQMDEAGYQRQVSRLADVRRTRDNRAVQQCLRDLGQAARREQGNLMPLILDAVREEATLQEMMDVLREVWGVYEEAVVL